MVRHLRRFLQRAAVLQISGDARRPKGMIADLRGDAGGFGAPLDHRIGIRLGQGIAGELAGRTAVSLEQHRLRLVRQPRAVEIFMQVGFEIVMAGHGMLLATLLLQAQPERRLNPGRGSTYQTEEAVPDKRSQRYGSRSEPSKWQWALSRTSKWQWALSTKTAFEPPVPGDINKLLTVTLMPQTIGDLCVQFFNEG
jgi:hypothetical protein